MFYPPQPTNQPRTQKVIQMPSTIAVSGTGIAGLAAASAVISSGRSCLLIGPSPSPLFGPKPSGGVQLAPNGWAALKLLGLDQKLMPTATRLHEIVVRSLTTGASLIRLPLGDIYAGVARNDLANLFHTQIADNPHLIQADTSIAQASQTRSGLNLVDQDATLHQVAGLVAADGAAGFGSAYVTSSAAQHTSGQATQSFPGQATQSVKVALRSVIPQAALPTSFSHTVSNLWLGDGIHIVHYPINDHANIVVVMPRTLATQGWQTRMFDQTSPLRALADSSIKWVSTPLPRASVSVCWRRGRVVLAGDAAHTMPPHLAQGAGQSLQDAASLMAALDQHDDIDIAFAHYARHRAGAVAKIAQKAETSGNIMGFSGLAGRLRNIALDLGGEPLLKSWLTEVWAADSGLGRL
jgi:salicylate hydroxylase